MASRALLPLIAAIAVSGCARAPVRSPQEAFRRVPAPELSDDLPLEPLLAAIERQAAFLAKENHKVSDPLVLGADSYPRAEYLAGLRAFVQRARKDQEGALADLRANFAFYEVYGGDGWGEVLVTSYYEPVIEGSRSRTPRFSQPLYKDPGDIVEVDLKAFAEAWPPSGKEVTAWTPILRGRLAKDPSDAGNPVVIPYFTREEIDAGALAGRKLALAWVDPVDLFFLQIQGSGTVLLPGGRLRVGYADQNGQKYEPIGKHLTEVIPIEEMSMQRIQAHLRSLPEEERMALLHLNPSYVFFRKLDGAPVTYLGTEVVDGRTIATDPTVFPKGALAYLEFEAPVFESDADAHPSETRRTARLVLDQDKGGAITGSGRVDLYWGSGADAGRNAGVLKSPGRLYYLAPLSAAALAP